jgi:hypothetical protein
LDEEELDEEDELEEVRLLAAALEETTLLDASSSLSLPSLSIFIEQPAKIKQARGNRMKTGCFSMKTLLGPLGPLLLS